MSTGDFLNNWTSANEGQFYEMERVLSQQRIKGKVNIVSWLSFQWDKQLKHHIFIVFLCGCWIWHLKLFLQRLFCLDRASYMMERLQLSCIFMGDWGELKWKRLKRAFRCYKPSPERIQEASDVLAVGILQHLKSKHQPGSATTANVQHYVFNYIFKGKGSSSKKAGCILLNKYDFTRCNFLSKEYNDWH